MALLSRILTVAHMASTWPLKGLLYHDFWASTYIPVVLGLPMSRAYLVGAWKRSKSSCRVQVHRAKRGSGYFIITELSSKNHTDHDR